MQIKNIIDHLKKNYGAELALLEGGAGNYDLSLFTDIKDDVLRQNVADHLVREGKLNGAELAGIMDPEKIRLEGLEDPGLYMENLGVYREFLKHKGQVNDILAALDKNIGELKDRVYSDGLKELDAKCLSYARGKTDLAGYLVYLSGIPAAGLGGIAPGANISVLVKIAGDEKNIDFNKADTQREELIMEITKRISSSEMKDLVNNMTGLSEGTVFKTAFYSYLVKKAASCDIDAITLCPDLLGYKKYVEAYESIDKWALFSELETFEENIFSALCENPDQRGLHKVSRDLSLLKDLFGLTFSAEQFRYCKENGISLEAASFASFIRSCSAKYGLEPELPAGLLDLDGHRRNMERFYELAGVRDEAFAGKVKSAIGGEELRRTWDVAGRPWDVGRGTSRGDRGTWDVGRRTFEVSDVPRPTSHVPRILIAVTGGFHSDNLLKQFRDSNIPYISILPNFTNEESYECPYQTIMSGEPTGFGKSIQAAVSAMQVPSFLSELGIKANDPAERELFRLEAIALRSTLGTDRPQGFRLTNGKHVILDRNNGSPIAYVTYEKPANADILSEEAVHGDPGSLLAAFSEIGHKNVIREVNTASGTVPEGTPLRTGNAQNTEILGRAPDIDAFLREYIPAVYLEGYRWNRDLALPRGMGDELRGYLELVNQHGNELGSFVRDAAVRINSDEYQFKSCETRREAFEYLGLSPEDIATRENRTELMDKLFSLAENDPCHVAYFDDGGHRYVWLASPDKEKHGAVEIEERYFMDGHDIAHGSTNIAGKTASFRMGLNASNATHPEKSAREIEGEGHMRIFFGMKQSAIQKIYHPDFIVIPGYQFFGRRKNTILFYLKAGYIPLYKRYREGTGGVIRNFFEPWFRDRSFWVDNVLEALPFLRGRDPNVPCDLVLYTGAGAENYADVLKRLNKDVVSPTIDAEISTYSEPLRLPDLYKRLNGLKGSGKAVSKEIVILGPGITQAGASAQTVEIAALFNDPETSITVVDSNKKALGLAGNPEFYDTKFKSEHLKGDLDFMLSALKEILTGGKYDENEPFGERTRRYHIGPETIKAKINTYRGWFADLDYGEGRIDIMVATHSIFYAFNFMPVRERIAFLGKLVRSLKGNGEGRLFIDTATLQQLRDVDPDEDIEFETRKRLASELENELKGAGIPVEIVVTGEIVEIVNVGSEDGGAPEIEGRRWRNFPEGWSDRVDLVGRVIAEHPSFANDHEGLFEYLEKEYPGLLSGESGDKRKSSLATMEQSAMGYYYHLSGERSAALIARFGFYGEVGYDSANFTDSVSTASNNEWIWYDDIQNAGNGDPLYIVFRAPHILMKSVHEEDMGMGRWMALSKISKVNAVPDELRSELRNDRIKYWEGFSLERHLDEVQARDKLGWLSPEFIDAKATNYVNSINLKYIKPVYDRSELKKKLELRRVPSGTVPEGTSFGAGGEGRSGNPRSVVRVKATGEMSYEGPERYVLSSYRKAGDKSDPLAEFLVKTAEKHLGYVPVIVITGDAAELITGDGVIDWNNVRSLDIKMFAKHGQKVEWHDSRFRAISDEIAGNIGKADFWVAHGRDKELRIKLDLQFNAYPLEALFTSGNFRPGDVVSGDIDTYNRFLTKLGPDGILALWMNNVKDRAQVSVEFAGMDGNALRDHLKRSYFRTEGQAPLVTDDDRRINDEGIIVGVDKRKVETTTQAYRYKDLDSYLGERLKKSGARAGVFVEMGLGTLNGYYEGEGISRGFAPTFFEWYERLKGLGLSEDTGKKFELVGVDNQEHVINGVDAKISALKSAGEVGEDIRCVEASFGDLDKIFDRGIDYIRVMALFRHYQIPREQGYMRSRIANSLNNGGTFVDGDFNFAFIYEKDPVEGLELKELAFDFSQDIFQENSGYEIKKLKDYLRFYLEHVMSPANRAGMSAYIEALISAIEDFQGYNGDNSYERFMARLRSSLPDGLRETVHADPNGVISIVPGEKIVTCGTICEAGHQKLLDPKLEEFYRGLAEEADMVLEGQGSGVKGQGMYVNKGILRERDVLDCLEIAGKLEELGTDRGEVEKIIEFIRHEAGIPGGDGGIDILFAIPPDGKKLWWTENPEWEGLLYGGGHFNRKRTRIHISLPLILGEGGFEEQKKAALAIAEHEFKHIRKKEVLHDRSDAGMRLVMKAALEEDYHFDWGRKGDPATENDTALIKTIKAGCVYFPCDFSEEREYRFRLPTVPVDEHVKVFDIDLSDKEKAMGGEIKEIWELSVPSNRELDNVAVAKPGQLVMIERDNPRYKAVFSPGFYICTSIQIRATDARGKEWFGMAHIWPRSGDAYLEEGYAFKQFIGIVKYLEKNKYSDVTMQIGVNTGEMRGIPEVEKMEALAKSLGFTVLDPIIRWTHENAFFSFENVLTFYDRMVINHTDNHQYGYDETRTFGWSERLVPDEDAETQATLSILSGLCSEEMGFKKAYRHFSEYSGYYVEFFKYRAGIKMGNTDLGKYAAALLNRKDALYPSFEDERKYLLACFRDSMLVNRYRAPFELVFGTDDRGSDAVIGLLIGKIANKDRHIRLTTYGSGKRPKELEDAARLIAEVMNKNFLEENISEWSLEIDVIDIDPGTMSEHKLYFDGTKFGFGKTVITYGYGDLLDKEQWNNIFKKKTDIALLRNIALQWERGSPTETTQYLLKNNDFMIRLLGSIRPDGFLIYSDYDNEEIIYPPVEEHRMPPAYVTGTSMAILETFTGANGGDKASLMTNPCTIGLVIKAHNGEDVDALLEEQLAGEWEVISRKVGKKILKERGLMECEPVDNVKYVIYVDDGTGSEDNMRRLDEFRGLLEARKKDEIVFTWAFSDIAKDKIDGAAYMVGLEGDFLPVSWQMLAARHYVNYIYSKLNKSDDETRIKDIIEKVIKCAGLMTEGAIDPLKLRGDLENMPLNELFNGRSIILPIPGMLGAEIKEYRLADRKIQESL
ncbi:MAG: hypothetical protein HQL30_02805 [Candidatus Omnitrophica bacterium]|nr:hypothetical protein [Candidatus Omnitrophota bacterium]